MDEIVAQSWRAAAKALPALTGISDVDRVPTHMALRLINYSEMLRIPTRDGSLPVHTGDRPVQRWTTMAAPSQEDLESVKRELARSAAVEVFEPDAA